MGRVVVLIGAPGSGKSSVGEELELLGLRWRDWEPELLARWGGRDGFIANKDVALEEHRRELLEFIDAAMTPAVLESTGLSDRLFLDELRGARPDAFFVRLDVAEESAVERIGARVQGRHFADDEEANRGAWRAFQDFVVPGRVVDLVIDTAVVSAAEAARAIVAALES